MHNNEKKRKEKGDLNRERKKSNKKKKYNKARDKTLSEKMTHPGI